ncbi:hypothetical protein ABZ387_17610 [Streptomyces flaveolus]|uniref:hypothetical protein n=1 Tax=Streptomyces flaveolus TaxID=67297 RepID=UPI003400EF55
MTTPRATHHRTTRQTRRAPAAQHPRRVLSAEHPAASRPSGSPATAPGGHA